jgi:hypothetical protein
MSEEPQNDFEDAFEDDDVKDETDEIVDEGES